MLPAVRRHRRAAAAVLATALGYYAGARIGLLPAVVRGQITPFWPPTGIAVACLLTFGMRCWPGITLGALAVNAPLGPNVAAVFGIAVGNTLAPVAAAAFLQAVGFGLRLSRVRDGLALVVCGAGGMLVSASTGTTCLWLAGVVPPGRFWSTWSVWWTGDAMGVLVVAPPLLLLSRQRSVPVVPWMRRVEAVGYLAAVSALAYVLIAVGSPALALLCPALVWGALRFGQPGTASAVLIMSVTACASVASGRGPFVRSDMFTSMMALQAFNGAFALSGLLVGAAVTQLDQARRDLHIANAHLTRRVEERGAQLAAHRSRIDVLADRQRIATQLHDTVLQRLFGAGVALEGVARVEHPAQQRVTEVLDELDACVDDLAVAIYRFDTDAFDSSLAEAVSHVLDAAEHVAGMRPRLMIVGDTEQVPIAMRQQLLASLQETLADLASHSAPDDLAVTLAVSTAEVAMTVSAKHHPSLGPSRALHGEGIRMADARAKRLGGHCEWRSSGPRSVVSWRFPTSRQARATA